MILNGGPSKGKDSFGRFYNQNEFSFNATWASRPTGSKRRFMSKSVINVYIEWRKIRWFFPLGPLFLLSFPTRFNQSGIKNGWQLLWLNWGKVFILATNSPATHKKTWIIRMINQLSQPVFLAWECIFLLCAWSNLQNRMDFLSAESFLSYFFLGSKHMHYDRKQGFFRDVRTRALIMVFPPKHAMFQ